MQKIIHFTFLFLCWTILSWCDSLVLINDSNIQLNVVVEDASGTILEETIINPGDSSTWSLDYEYYGYDAQSSNPQVPYTVNWYCVSGELFGTCVDVASDSTVLAQSCGGSHQCSGSEENE